MFNSGVCVSKGVNDFKEANSIVCQMMRNDPNLSISLERTGIFKSRTVKYGNNTCSVQQLISEIGHRIKNSDNEFELKDLREALKKFSKDEKKDRGITSSLFHLFSNRKKDVKSLKKTASAKIANFTLKENAFHVNQSSVSQFDKIEFLFKAGKRLDDDVRETKFYINYSNKTPLSYSLKKKDDDSEEKCVYIKNIQDPNGDSYSFKRKDFGNMSDIITYLPFEDI